MTAPAIIRTAKFSTRIRAGASRRAEVIGHTRPGSLYRIRATVFDGAEFWYRIGKGMWVVRERRGVTTFREDRPLERVK